jgi:hypothetical protein
MEIAAILTAVAAVIGAVTGLASILAPFFPKKPAPPYPDNRTNTAKMIDRLSMVPTGSLNGKNGKEK